MAFEVGKKYKHISGEEWSKVTEEENIIWGKCFLVKGERNTHLIPVETSSENWVEIK